MAITKKTKTPESTIYIVEVDNKKWKEAQAKIRKELEKNVDIPGFRKGHAPKEKLNEYVTNYDVLPRASQQVVNELIDEFWKEFDKNPNTDVLQQSLSIAVDEITPDKHSFRFVFDNHPTVNLKDYDKIELDYVAPVVTPEEIEAEINNYLKNDYMLTPKNGPIANGDMVKFDFKGYIDNKAFEGGEAKDYELEIGSHQFIPGFEEGMIGLKKGDKKSINVTFPKDYFEKKYAGKPAKFDVEIKEVSTITKPKLDEAYLTKLRLPNIKTAADFRKYIETNIKKMKDYGAKQPAINAIRQFMLDKANVSFIPQNYLNQEIERAKEQNEQEAKKAKKSVEEYVTQDLKYKSLQEYEDKLRENITRSIKYSLVVAYIIEQLKIMIDEKELDQELTNLASMYQIPVDKFKQDINMIERIRGFLLEEKLYDKLIELNKNNKKTKSNKGK